MKLNENYNAELANALADPIRYISNLEKREKMLKSMVSDEILDEVIIKEPAQDIEITNKVNFKNNRRYLLISIPSIISEIPLMLYIIAFFGMLTQHVEYKNLPIIIA